MIQTLLDNDNPVIREIASSRSSYPYRLLAALSLTTCVAGTIAIYLLNKNVTPASTDVSHFNSITSESLTLVEAQTDEHRPDSAILQAAIKPTSKKEPTTIYGNDDLRDVPPLSPAGLTLHKIARGNQTQASTITSVPTVTVDALNPKTLSVRVRYERATVRDVLNDITAKTGLFFSIPSHAPVNTPNITLQDREWIVHDLLVYVLGRNGLDYWKGSARTIALFTPHSL